MRERAKRLLIAAGLGLLVAAVNDRLDVEFTRLGVPLASTYLNDLIVGAVAAVSAYAWAAVLWERGERLASAERLREEGVLHERSRLAREIHDTLAQGFAAIIVNLEAAGEYLRKTPDARALCDRALRISRESLAEARSMARGLRPLTREGENLRQAVGRIADSLEGAAGLHVKCFVEEMSGHVPADVEAELLQIIREALTNVVRHSGAREARVVMRAEENLIQMCVEDDGCGFRPENAPAAEGFGLASMRERAKNLGGVLWVYSRPGQGTQVAACIPFDDAADPRSKPRRSAVTSEAPLPIAPPPITRDSRR
jgi:signal transduction histidine kinase